MSNARERRAVLGIDTAGPVVGACLYGPAGTHGFSRRITRGADTVLAEGIQGLLRRADEDDGPFGGRGIELVAVSVGPGAFTGLRVGVATALGIAVARGVPVVAVSSLEARACLVSGGRVLALLDARKGRVYAGAYEGRQGEWSCLGEWDRPLADVLQDARAAGRSFDVAVGEGARVFAAELQEAGIDLAEDPGRCPADEVARLGFLRSTGAVEAGAVALRYLRPPDARLPGART